MLVKISYHVTIIQIKNNVIIIRIIKYYYFKISSNINILNIKYVRQFEGNFGSPQFKLFLLLDIFFIYISNVILFPGLPSENPLPILPPPNSMRALPHLVREVCHCEGKASVSHWARQALPSVIHSCLSWLQSDQDAQLSAPS